ncbi:DUF397 domain-containing protein [Nocardiopsis metallicus]|uniref:Nitrite reductase/ring-hydroxylating ferredoxin subunit n=1 Tax=Nocardiopsis metallicus TaxID=179819 RepID=A0A840WGI1_9ACTN|nr:DUF397 domain-containing protein [Nocardiopsis metallicus]MBB5490827.1 nitrite reductase/ring-hydroxylating ferredoxin subunit [Nocardiopsis metallicus]
MTEHEATTASTVPASPWHTASYSAERGTCVEVAEGSTTGVRDTQNRELGALFFGAIEWQAFLDSARINS